MTQRKKPEPVGGDLSVVESVSHAGVYVNGEPFGDDHQGMYRRTAAGSPPMETGIKITAGEESVVSPTLYYSASYPNTAAFLQTLNVGVSMFPNTTETVTFRWGVKNVDEGNFAPYYYNTPGGNSATLSPPTFRFETTTQVTSGQFVVDYSLYNRSFGPLANLFYEEGAEDQYSVFPTVVDQLTFTASVQADQTATARLTAILFTMTGLPDW